VIELAYLTVIPTANDTDVSVHQNAHFFLLFYHLNIIMYVLQAFLQRESGEIN